MTTQRQYHIVYILKQNLGLPHPTSMRASRFSKTARLKRKAPFCTVADHTKLAQ